MCVHVIFSVILNSYTVHNIMSLYNKTSHSASNDSRFGMHHDHYLITKQIITQKENSIFLQDKICNVKFNDLKWTNHIDVYNKGGLGHSKSNCVKLQKFPCLLRDSKFVCEVLRSVHNLLFRISTLSLKQNQLYSL